MSNQIVLNPNLVKKQNLSDEQITKITELHTEKRHLMDLMTKVDTVSLLKYYANQIENIEFSLQELWGFPKDRNYHRFWDVPKCTCPKMDNLERIGTEYKIYNSNCPIHS